MEHLSLAATISMQSPCHLGLCTESGNLVENGSRKAGWERYHYVTTFQVSMISTPAPP